MVVSTVVAHADIRIIVNMIAHIMAPIGIGAAGFAKLGGILIFAISLKGFAIRKGRTLRFGNAC